MNYFDELSQMAKELKPFANVEIQGESASAFIHAHAGGRGAEVYKDSGTWFIELWDGNDTPAVEEHPCPDEREVTEKIEAWFVTRVDACAIRVSND